MCSAPLCADLDEGPMHVASDFLARLPDLLRLLLLVSAAHPVHFNIESPSSGRGTNPRFLGLSFGLHALSKATYRILLLLL